MSGKISESNQSSIFSVPEQNFSQNPISYSIASHINIVNMTYYILTDSQFNSFLSLELGFQMH